MLFRTCLGPKRVAIPMCLFHFSARSPTTLPETKPVGEYEYLEKWSPPLPKLDADNRGIVVIAPEQANSLSIRNAGNGIHPAIEAGPSSFDRRRRSQSG